MRRHLLLGVVLVALFPFALFASDLLGVFSTDSDHTIPSLPVTFRVAVTNTSSHAVALPRALAVRVIRPTGDVFWTDIGLTQPQRWGGWPMAYENLHTLGPGETRIFELPAQDNGFFRDDRLTKPGRYQLQLVLADGDETAPGAVLTNAVSISVQAPSGEDAAVWRWMNKIADKPWGVVEWARFRKELVQEVFDHHPGSQYAPFLYFSQVVAATPAHLQQLTRYHDDGPFHDWIQSAVANAYIAIVRSEFDKPSDHRDATRAIRAAEEIDRIVTNLERNADSPLLRLTLEQNRDLIPTAEGAQRTGRTKEPIRSAESNEVRNQG
jgi:hypothetical protein